MKNLLKKFIRKFVIFLRYNPFNFAISLRRYFYKFLFKKSGASFNITDNVIINFPEPQSDDELSTNVRDVNSLATLKFMVPRAIVIKPAED